MSLMSPCSDEQSILECSIWNPSNRTLPVDDSSSDEERPAQTTADETIQKYNQCMSTIAKCTSYKQISPLSFQLTSTWDELTQSEKDVCIDKAQEACQVICEVIAPKAGEDLFQAMSDSSDNIRLSEELVSLMTAFRNASTRKLKLQ